MDLGLHRVRGAIAALGLETPTATSFQVVGTNGKGSTSTFLAALLEAAGYPCGLSTSPHFLSPKERILCGKTTPPDALWLDAAEATLAVSADKAQDKTLTYFELLTVMAARIFARTNRQATVFEAGLGGASDATSALAHHVTVFTPIGLDHMAVLGPTLEDIARDKARAMRPERWAVTARQEPAVLEVLATQARNVGAPLWRLPEPGEEGRLMPVFLPGPHGSSGLDADTPAWPVIGLGAIPLPRLAGIHQQENLRLAWAACLLAARLRGLSVGPEALQAAAGEAFIAGRLQPIAPQGGLPALLLDGAHNRDGLLCLRQALGDMGIVPSAMIFSCLEDKDWRSVLPLARSLTGGPVYVPPLSIRGRAADPARLASGLGGPAAAVRGMAEAFQAVRGIEGTVLVCGSLYLLAEAYALRPRWLHPYAG